jgi:hypothetical protein
LIHEISTQTEASTTGRLNLPADQGNPATAHAAHQDIAMIRFLFRFLGLLILASAFVALVYDGTNSIAAKDIVVTPLGKVWQNFNQNSLLLLQPAVERHVAPWVWQILIQPVLERPTWLVLGILGAILILLGRKKKPLIGYARD